MKKVLTDSNINNSVSSTESILRRELFDLKNRQVKDFIRIREIERILSPIEGKSTT